MRDLLRPFPFTSAALALALLVLVAALFWHINVFDMPELSVIGIEQSEIGEIVIAFLLVIPAFFVDRVVARERRHEAELQAEQLRVLRVTMRTVQDIVNNNLNQLQLLRFEAEGHVSNETLTHFDATIQDTAAQLTALGNMEVFAETPMAIGSGLAGPMKN
jgi:fumarate reductase subunit D